MFTIKKVFLTTHSKCGLYSNRNKKNSFDTKDSTKKAIVYLGNQFFINFYHKSKYY